MIRDTVEPVSVPGFDGRSNVLTIDVEEYFQVSAFESTIPYESWDSHSSRLMPALERVLSILSDHNVKATFFVLGWNAVRHPRLVRLIQQDGHEVASHGYTHRLVYYQSPDDFRADVARSKAVLEDATGEPVLGYRAPSYSITSGSVWALDILAELGMIYDSSIFPIKHDLGGGLEASRYPFVLNLNGGSRLIELPPSTTPMGRYNIPIAGGGYIRLFPYWFVRRSLRAINRDNQPAIVYLHPWELDAHQPRQRVGAITRTRHYLNLSWTERKLLNLLRDFRFVPIRDVLHQVLCEKGTVYVKNQ